MARAIGVAVCAWLLIQAASAQAAYGPGMYDDRFPQTVTSAQMETKARAKLDEMLRDSGETRRREITLEKPATDMQIPAGRITIDARIPTGVHYGKRTPVHVLVSLNGKVYRRAIFYYRVQVFDRIVVAGRNLFPSDTITASDLRVEEREVLAKEDRWLRRIDDAVGRQPRSLIEAGTVLTETSVVSPYIIEAGANVTIISEYNGVEVRATGVALGRGRAGQRIRVRNAISNRVIMAEVIDATMVKIVK